MTLMIRTLVLVLLLCKSAEAIKLQPESLDLVDTRWGVKLTDLQVPNNFTLRHCERADSYAWSGFVLDEEAVLVCTFTPDTKQLCEVNLIIGKERGFKHAKASYQKYKKLLVTLYKKPTHSYEIFTNPFDNVEGRRDSALESGKYNLSDFWMKFPNTLIGMSITPEGWVCITFESKLLGIDNKKD